MEVWILSLQGDFKIFRIIFVLFCVLRKDSNGWESINNLQANIWIVSWLFFNLHIRLLYISSGISPSKTFFRGICVLYSRNYVLFDEFSQLNLHLFLKIRYFVTKFSCFFHINSVVFAKLMHYFSRIFAFFSNFLIRSQKFRNSYVAKISHIFANQIRAK